MTLITSPSNKNLMIGKGKWFARMHDPITGVAGPYIHLGNAPTAEVSLDDTRLQKFTSMSADAGLYDDNLKTRLMTLKLLLDEGSKENIRMALMGEEQTAITQAATPVVDQVVSAAVVLGQTYILNTFGKASSVVLEKDGSPDVTLVLGTDYIWIDQNHNAFQILSTAVNITGGDTLNASYTPLLIAAGDIAAISGGKASKIGLSLLFLGDPTKGPRQRVDIWKGSVNPDGAFGWISEEYGQISLSIAIENDAAGLYGGSEAYPYFRELILGT